MLPMLFTVLLALLAPPSSQFGYPLGFGPDKVVCSGSHRTHVLYVWLANSRDQYDFHVRYIRQQAQDISGILDTEADVSSDTIGSRIRYVCSGNRPRVTKVGRIDSGDDKGFATRVVEELRARGFDNPSRKYLVYVNGTNSGKAWGNQYAFVGVGGGRPPVEMALHEWLHSLGAVDPDAPDAEGRHCTDRLDVMCYPSDRLPCSERLWVDCGRDTYFSPHPTGWLAKHPEANVAACSNPWTNCTYTGNNPDPQPSWWPLSLF